MTTPNFDDMLQISKGGPKMTHGGGAIRVEDLSTLEEWDCKAESLRNLWKLLLGRMPDGYDVPLDPRTEAEEDAGDYIKRTVSYNVGPGERIRAYLLLPKNRPTPRPAVLTIHPTTSLGKEQSIGNDPSPGGRDRAYGVHLVNRGYITLSYDLLSANERKYPGLDDFYTEPFYEQFPEWSVRGKDLWDVSRAIDFLLTLPEVDPERIGSIGHSQGGGITIDAMMIEPRIKAGVSSCGDWPARLFKNPFARARTGWWIGMPNLRPFCWCGKEWPVDLHEKLALAAPRAIMVQTALNDWDYGLDEEPLTRPVFENLEKNVKRVFDLYGRADHFVSVLHRDGHGFIEQNRTPAYAFLDKHLTPDQ